MSGTRHGTCSLSPASRRTILGAGLAAVASVLTPTRGHSAPKSLEYVGINLAGAEFGAPPGVYGRDYIYPAPSLIEYYASHGFNLIRLPFLWERVQPEINQELAGAELKRLGETVENAARRDMQVVLDPHNYAHRKMASDGWMAEHAIGSATVPSSAFADLWSRLANRFKASSNVIFGLMNEPKDIASTAWLPIANEAVAAIRSAGADQLILIPGVAYTGAHSWLKVHNTVMAGVVDPKRNFAFDVHQYLDGDSSGTSPAVVSNTIGSQRVAAFQDWARSHGFKAFLGEFGAAATEPALQALEDLCRTLQANSDVWIGCAAWAGGSWWREDYMFNLDPPKSGEMRPQTRILADFARGQRG